MDHETWLIDRCDKVVDKKSDGGIDSLSEWEKVVYCLWVADYSIRNAGDLQTARDLYVKYRDDLLPLASQLGLPQTAIAFALSDDELVRQYDARFQDVCDEVRKAEPTA